MPVSLKDLALARKKAADAVAEARRRQKEGRRSGAAADVRAALAKAVAEAEQNYQFADEDYQDGKITEVAQAQAQKRESGKALLARTEDTFSKGLELAAEIDADVAKLGEKIVTFLEMEHGGRNDFITAQRAILGNPSDPTFLSFATFDFTPVFEALAA